MIHVIRTTVHRPFLVFLLALLPTGTALAASATSSQQPATSAALLIAFAIVYLSRKKAIGGWLLYFYLQLYFSLLVSLIFVPQMVSNLAPAGAWDNAWLYVMFFLSVVPVFMLKALKYSQQRGY